MGPLYFIPMGGTATASTMIRLIQLKCLSSILAKVSIPSWLCVCFSSLFLVCLASPVGTGAPAKHREYLTPAEIDEIREAQDINDRVPLFLKFAEIRLKEAAKLSGIVSSEKPNEQSRKRETPDTRKVKSAKDEPERTTTDALDDYLSIYEEMLRRLEQNVDEGIDCRKALKSLLKQTPGLQAQLQGIARQLGDEAPDSLAKALDDAATAPDTGRKTLAEQEGKFKEEKKRQKESNRDKRN